MCSDFQSADAVNVGEVLRVPSPIAVRWALIRASAAEARSGRRVPHPAPGVQLLTADRVGAAAAGPTLNSAASAVATIAALTNFLPIEPPEVSDSTG
jgi:hypothetical protein